MKTPNNNKGFTLIELLVVIAIIALLLAILMPSLSKVKELGKRVVCLSSVRQLTMAWRMYADANDDKICAANVGNSDWGWIARDGVDGNPEQQRNAIRAGVLFPYVETMDIYTCPTAKRDEVRSYSAVASMNTNIGTSHKGKVYKSLAKIKNPFSMLVFVCEGQITNHAYRVYYDEPIWKDPGPIRHSIGTVFSFVDGHSESWDWKDPRTGDPELDLLQPQPDNPDLERLQRGMWGKLGY